MGPMSGTIYNSEKNDTLRTLFCQEASLAPGHRRRQIRTFSSSQCHFFFIVSIPFHLLLPPRELSSRSSLPFLTSKYLTKG
jgi:hypothetical protein